MNIQVCLPGEIPAAAAAQKWLFTGMRPKMDTQIVAGVKALGAHSARVRSMLGMRPAMLLQNIGRGE